MNKMIVEKKSAECQDDRSGIRWFAEFIGLT